jgi:hypothetical protein
VSMKNFITDGLGYVDDLKLVEIEDPQIRR